MDPFIEQQAKNLSPKNFGNLSPPNTGNTLNDFILKVLQTAPLAVGRSPVSNYSPVLPLGQQTGVISPSTINAAMRPMKREHVSPSNYNQSYSEQRHIANNKKLNDKAMKNYIRLLNGLEPLP